MILRVTWAFWVLAIGTLWAGDRLHTSEFDFQDNSTITSITVQLDEQKVYFYHDQLQVGWSMASTGRSGHRTPPGQYVITEKDPDHHSNLYDNAPMPFFLRLSDEGMGIHAGVLPGYPASHGCIRLPYGAAKHIFPLVESGVQVVIQ